MDFLSKKFVVLFLKSCNFKIGKDFVCFNLEKSCVYLCVRIRVVELVLIFFNSEMFILGYIDGEYRDDKGLLEFFKVVKNKEFLMCKLIVKFQNKIVFVLVVNVNNCFFKLDRDIIIVSLQLFGNLVDMLDKFLEK